MGESIVLAPLLSDFLPWLGDINVSIGMIYGNSIFKYRKYFIHAKVLAEGHCTLWKIGREFRYKEMRKILFDELYQIIRNFGLDSEFVDLFDQFPSKKCKDKNSIETARYRQISFQLYINKIFHILRKILLRRKKYTKQKILKYNPSHNSPLIKKSSDIETEIKDSLKSGDITAVNVDINSIVHLIIYKLLGIDPNLQKKISFISSSLGKHIVTCPGYHYHIDKNFEIIPQQPL